MSNRQDRRAELTRDYPIVEVPFRGSSVEVRAGEGELLGIRGWILTFGYPDDVSGHQLLVGHLDLRYPLKRHLAFRIDGFDAGEGGAIFLPWPYVGFSIEDVATAPPPAHGYSKAIVSFVPVLADDPAPPGLGSVITGRTQVSVEPPGVAVEVPAGCTQYRVLPATTLAAEKRITVEERSGELVWARYTIDPAEPLASNAALGHCAWNETPLAPRATIGLAHDDNGHRHVTVYWRFDLGRIR